jgi:hypothetical protein
MMGDPRQGSLSGDWGTVMAGPVTRPSDVDPSLRPNYAPAAERYAKLAELTEAKVEQQRAARDQARVDHRRANKEAREAMKSAEEAHAALDVLDQHRQALEGVIAETTTQLDAAKAQGDTTRVAELEAKQARAQQDLGRNAASFEDQRQWAEATQGDLERKLQEVVAAEKAVEDASGQLAKLETSLEHFEDASHWNDLADRNQKVANVAMQGDPAATRQAVLEESVRRRDELQDVSARQAETFEELERTRADVKSLTGELDRSQRAQDTLEAQVKKLEADGQYDKWAIARQDLDIRKQRTTELRDRLSDANEEAATLTQRNASLDRDVRSTREDVERLRKVADQAPSEVEAEFRRREEGSGDLGTIVSPVTEEDEALAKELEQPDGPITDPSQVSDLRADPGDGLDAIDTPTATAQADAAPDDSTPAAGVDELDGLDDLDRADAGAGVDTTQVAAAVPTVVDDEMLEPVAVEPQGTDEQPADVAPLEPPEPMAEKVEPTFEEIEPPVETDAGLGEVEVTDVEPQVDELEPMAE